MSLYALTAAAVAGLKQKYWGAKIPTQFQTGADGSVTPVEGGDTADTGVQEAITALVNRLASQEPIPLVGALQLKQDGNAPAMQVFVDNSQNVDNFNSVIQFVDVSNNTVTDIGTNGITISNYYNSDNPPPANSPPPPSGTTNQPANSPTSSSGFSGTLTTVTGVSGSVTISGCNGTVDLTLTTSTITFSNGQVTGVA